MGKNHKHVIHEMISKRLIKYEKVLKSRNCKLNDSARVLYTHKNDLKKLTLLSISMDVVQLEFSHAVSGSVNWYNHFREVVIIYEAKHMHSL